MSRLIIGLMGEAKTGKDTVANMLQAEYDFRHEAFAGKLKEACRVLFNFSDTQLHGSLKEVVDPFWNKTPRETLQFVGTELFRNQFDQNFWVKSLMSLIASNDNQRWVISDCRFRNEFQAIRDAGGKVIRLYRIDGVGAERGIEGHPSEVEMQSISDTEFDEVIKVPTGVPRLLAEARLIITNWIHEAEEKKLMQF